MTFFSRRSRRRVTFAVSETIVRFPRARRHVFGTDVSCRVSHPPPLPPPTRYRIAMSRIVCRPNRLVRVFCRRRIARDQRRRAENNNNNYDRRGINLIVVKKTR